LPIRSPAVVTRSALARAPVYFPLVGIGIGVFTAGTVALGLLIWPAWLAVLVALALEARLTGALHEDGLADFCDGFGGGWTRDEVLAIFEDSRIGTYGALGLLMAVALRAAAITALVMPRGFDDALAWGSAITASAALGRWAMVLALVCLAPVEGRASLSREVGADLRIRNLAIGSLWTLPAVAAFAVFSPWLALAALAAVLAACALFLRGVRRKLGGVTGDCLGCLCYLVQIVVLLVAAAQPGERHAGKFNRDPEGIAEKAVAGRTPVAWVRTVTAYRALTRDFLSDARRGARVAQQARDCSNSLVERRAPRRAFLAKSAKADFQECPLGRG
jgi:adenosylcobinamide-GDP ribazoletransferase